MTQNLPALFAMSDLEKMATAIVKSNLFGIKTADQAITLMLVAQAEGMHPATAARDYHIIQNRPAMKADAMLARFQQAGGVVEWIEYSDSKVAGRFTHPQSPKPVLIEWTLEMAKRIGLANKDNWRNYPRAMLRARVISEGVRTSYPAIATGIYTPEEVQDFAGEKDITPRGGVMEALPSERQRVLHETAAQMRSYLEEGKEWEAFNLQETSGFDADEQVALHGLFSSKQRALLKRMKDAERAQETGTINESQRKRLEARITELGLNRDVVKDYCKIQFGVEHFKELTGSQYQALDNELPALKGSTVTAPSQSTSGPTLPAGAGVTGEGATLSAEQIKTLLAECEQRGIKVERLLVSAKISKIDDLQAHRYAATLKWIQTR